MNAKSLKLLNYLQIQDDWTTASQLSLKLNVSLRSIKNYISDIKDTDPALILSSKNGYKVNRNELQTFLKTSESLIPQTPEERVDYIVTRLIKAEENSIDLYELSQEIYVSDATLRSDLNKAKKKCYEFDLTITIKGSIINLEGLEKNKRKIMSSILYSKWSRNPMNISTIQSAFKEYDIQHIEDIISDAFKKFHYFINDYSLKNLVLHITITTDRIKNNYVYDFIEKNNTALIKQHEYEIAREIAAGIESLYNITYNENEIHELCMLIISSATNLNYRNIDELNLEQLVGTRCMNLVKELIHYIRDYYYIEFNEPEFLVRFSIHIKNLLVRCESSYFCKNPLTESIKNNCPLIYDCAVNISYKIKTFTKCDINEDEIAYIALHIGCALENQKNLNSQISCCIFFPQYYNLDIKLAEKLTSAFQNQLLIKYIITSEQELKNIKADLILSTVKFTNTNSLPFVMINPFLTDKDHMLIAGKLEEVKKNKQKLQFSEYLHSIFNKSLFLKDRNFENETEAIDFMCSEMEKHGYISPDFKQEVLDREAMSSTAFNGIAVPHSMKMDAIKTGMFAVVNQQPVKWGKQQVNIIFLLTINKNEKKVFHDMFDTLTTILSEEANLRKLISCGSFEEFISMIVECI